MCSWAHGCEDGQSRGMCVQARTGYQALSSMPLHFECSVSGLSALPTKLSSGVFAFPLLELSHALLDMINEFPLNQEPNRILSSLSYTMGKVAKRLGMTLYTN